jgi:hypothetical protein
MKWTVPKVWDGGQCVIIGGGPSIIKQFDIPESLVKQVYEGKADVSSYSPYLERIHAEHIIAVNMAYKLGDWIDMLFFGDPSYWKKNKYDILNFRGLRVSCAPDILDVKGVKYIAKNKQQKFGITDDPRMLSWNNNSGSSAINVAVHTGVKRIILLGFDMSLDTNKNQHWHKFYATDPRTIGRTLRSHLDGFGSMVHDLKKLNIEVLNCSPESKIEGFKKVNFKDIA